MVFKPLTEKEIEAIVDLQLAQIQARLAERRIHLSLDAAARKYLAKEGFDAEFGARPLKRLMQKLIVDALADKMIRGELKNGAKVNVQCRGGSLVLKA
jgi:ATP-dependent Clp protease ATP-binding subunit ClpB